MKKELITAKTIKETKARGERRIIEGPNIIITPAARDLAKELGIEIARGEGPPQEKSELDLKAISQAIGKVLTEEFGAQGLDEDTVRVIVTKVLERLG